MLKKIFLFPSLILFLLLLAACSDAKEAGTGGSERVQAFGKSLRLLFNIQSHAIDPHTDTTYIAVRAGIAETLVVISDELGLQPGLADDWSSKDGRHWTFHIREGAAFHDGQPLDAEAVKLSLVRAQELNPAVRNTLSLREIHADGQLLKLVTETPNLELPSSFVHPNTAIVAPSSTDSNPVGTGPFKLADFRSGSSLKVDRNTGYWGGPVKLDHAEILFNSDANARLMAIKAGSADIVFRPPLESFAQLQSDPSLTVESRSGLRTHLLMYNMRNRHLAQEQVRRAFDHLIDRETITKDIMAGQATPAAGAFPAEAPFSPAYRPKAFSLDLAREAFREAGFTVEGGKVSDQGKPLSFRLLTYSSRAELPLIAQLVQAHAGELGIKLEIRQAENMDEYLSANDDWDLATYSLVTAPRGEAAYFLNSGYLPEGALNYSHIDHPGLQAAIGTLNETVDAAERLERSRQAMAIADSETLNSFIVHPNIVVVYSGKVLGWKTTMSEYYLLTKDLDVAS